MKELSIEEKARRYDEAIEKAKSKIRDDKDHVLYEDDVKEIFPELKGLDLEDERIRTFLHHTFTAQHLCKDKLGKWHGEPVVNILAWLEKQGEPKEINPSEFDSQLNSLLKKFESLPKEELAGILNFYLNVVRNDGTYKEEKQGEQKIPKFKVGDFIQFKGMGHTRYTVKEVCGLSHYINTFNKRMDMSYTDANFELVEQKPAMIQWKGDNLKEVVDFTGVYKEGFEKWFHNSWEEYEKYVHEHNNIFKIFNEDGSHMEIPVGAWIIKAPDGYNIASKAVFKPAPIEWSKEDERIKNNLLSELTNLCVRKLIEKETEKKYASWLKSLRSQSTWKPSEEQLIQLSNASNRLYYNCETLLSLLEQLKKLK